MLEGPEGARPAVVLAVWQSLRPTDLLEQLRPKCLESQRQHAARRNRHGPHCR